MPRNVSPAIIIAGLPGALINNISFNNVEIWHPGGGNPLFAKVLLEALDSIPERASAYPDFSMFRELPAWGIYIRHARDILFNHISLFCTGKDYRTAIVLDDVHHSEFLSMNMKEGENKKRLFQHNSREIIWK